MRFTLATTLALLAVSVSAAGPVPDNSTTSDVTPVVLNLASGVINFCTTALGCAYPAQNIIPAACINFSPILRNQVVSVIVPNGFECTLFRDLACAGAMFTVLPPPNFQDIPGSLRANTNSYSCIILR
ncbi:hypothetical protein CPC08DRAFT_720244 [Agrocybe pediades]|nr:hypothetical protein CPC08DRAFT_720244 [Agrocybe pediades]